MKGSQSIRGTIIMINSRDKERLLTYTKENMKDSLSKERKMEKALSLTPTEIAIVENLKMTTQMARACSKVSINLNTKAISIKASVMVREKLYIKINQLLSEILSIT